MNHIEIINNIKKKIFHPIYLLHGEEPFFIDLISDFIENNSLEESERDFNQTVFYGKDVKIDDLIASAKSYPMMSNYQVIIVKEAQNIQKYDELNNYAKNPQKTTILVFCYKYKKFDGRKQFFKLVKEKGIEFESPKLYENQIPKWINEYVIENKFKIGGKATTMLLEFLGNDLSKITNELNKLFILSSQGEEITPEIIEKNIGISKDFNVFELYNNLGTKNVFKVFQIANYFKANQKENPPQKIIPMLFDYFNKVMLIHFESDKSERNIAKILGIREFFVKDYMMAYRSYPLNKTIKIISYLREYDMRSKGVEDVGTDGGELIKELLTKIIY